jgi:hypothetical protein
MPEHNHPLEPIGDIDFAEAFEVFEEERPDLLATEELSGFGGRASSTDCANCSMLG